jgi:4-amino-4-deoxy-L-arabinose transferase-like glycosyltransferase
VEDSENTQSKLARACWIITTLVFLVGGLGFMLKGDTAYGIVILVVAFSAAINLF